MIVCVCPTRVAPSNSLIVYDAGYFSSYVKVMYALSPDFAFCGVPVIGLLIVMSGGAVS